MKLKKTQTLAIIAASCIGLGASTSAFAQSGQSSQTASNSGNQGGNGTAVWQDPGSVRSNARAQRSTRGARGSNAQRAASAQRRNATSNADTGGRSNGRDVQDQAMKFESGGGGNSDNLRNKEAPELQRQVKR